MILMRAARHSLQYYFAAILAVILAAIFTAALAPFTSSPVYAFFYAAVTVSSWYGGTSSGLFATILAYIILHYFFIPPLNSFNLNELEDILRLGTLILLALLVGSLHANIKTAKQRLEYNLQELKDSEEGYRVLAENIPQLVWFTSVDGSVEYMNQRWYDYTGLSVIESLGWKWQQAVHSEDLPFVLEQWTNALENGHAIELQYRLRRKDGEYRWHIVHAVPLHDRTDSIKRWFGSCTDIHEQKQTEQRLYQQEQERNQLLVELESKQSQLEAVLEQMPAGLIIAEAPSGKLVLGNQQVEQIWRHSFLAVESIVQYKEYQGLHADGRPYSPQEWPLARSISKGEVVVNEEITLVRGDGTQGVILVNSTPIRDRQGQITAGVVTFYDITDYKQAQKALLQSEERFRQMAERIEDVFWISTIPEDYKVLYVSPAYERIWGCSCQSLYQNPRTWIESIHPEDRQRVETEFFERSLQGNFDIEFRIVRPDGSIRWVRDRSFPIQDSNGKTYRLVGVAEDITERKQTEAELKDSRALFASFMRHMPGCAFIKDEQGKYLFVNPVGAELVGLKIAEVIGKTDFEIVPTSIAQKLRENDLSILNSNQPVEFLDVIPQQDQESYWITYKFPFTDTNKRRLLAGMSFDITERKLAEQEREQLLQREQAAREQAETANRIKDEFLAVLSHELRSPLNPILGWAKLLRTRPADTQTIERALETIERNAKLQTKLIEDLLDVSRILRGKLNLNINPVNFTPLITQALETVSLAAQTKSLQIQTFVEDVCIVLGDSTRLQQVVWNILSNAVKFTPAGGKIEISLKKVDSQAQLQVRDTGKGINPEFLPHIFEYFRQADSSITRKFGGLGLGLAIVRHIVELHGGTIQAESLGEGQGATFTIWLPLLKDNKEQVQANSQRENISPDVLAGKKILTVDDEADMRDYIAFTLEQAGAEVMVAASADEVLRIFTQYKPDILLADIGMPNKDGYTLLRQLRQLSTEQGGQIPAIALTAYARDSDQQQAIAAGFQKHIVKPVDPAELVEVVSNLIHESEVSRTR